MSRDVSTSLDMTEANHCLPMKPRIDPHPQIITTLQNRHSELRRQRGTSQSPEVSSTL